MRQQGVERATSPRTPIPANPDLEQRFNAHPCCGDAHILFERTGDWARGLAHVTKQTVPPGRGQSLALTKLDKTIFWANSLVGWHRREHLKTLEHERRFPELVAKVEASKDSPARGGVVYLWHSRHECDWNVCASRHPGAIRGAVITVCPRL